MCTPVSSTLYCRGVRDILSFRSFTWQCIYQAKLQSFNAGTWLRMRGNCALGRGQVIMVLVVVVRGKIFCLRLKVCRGSRSIAPFITILGTRWRFGVGMATCYGLDGPGIESRWGDISRNFPDRPWGPPSLLYNECRASFPGGKTARAWRWQLSLSAPRLKKE